MPRTLVLLLALTASAVSAASQTTWIVAAQAAAPGAGTALSPFPLIQSAVAIAASGDTVLIGPGTYFESLDLLGKAITVVGRDGADATIVDASGLGRPVTCASGETAATVLDGMTLTGGDPGPFADGGGVLCDGASPIIRRCTIRANVARRGGGICVRNGSTTRVESCKVTQNSATERGGGIQSIGSSPVLDDSVVSDNGAVGRGGGIGLLQSMATIESCVVRGNVAGDCGGGIQVDQSIATVRQCRIPSNTSVVGGGLHFEASSAGLVTNTVIHDNVATFAGGGVISASSAPVFVHCTIANNTAGSLGGGLESFNGALVFANGIIWGNQPAAVGLTSGSPSIVYSDVEGGAPGAGNIDVDPRFIAPAAFNFHLQAGSPCIGAGDASFVPLPTIDIDGEPRVIGLGVDLGVDEVLNYSGTFIDRHDPTDLRLVTFNPQTDTIFPDVDAIQAEKFARIVQALDPDVISLQEITRLEADVVSLMNSIAPLPAGNVWHVKSGGGNVIASKYPLTYTACVPIPAGSGPLAMALVDLPDDRFDGDLFVIDDHFPCCVGNDPARQQQADSLVAWIRDARTPGGFLTLPAGTAIAVMGDLNLVESQQPLQTLLTGDIADEAAYGPDSAPDWDGTTLADPHPLHNGVGPDDYTWRVDGSGSAPRRLDYVLFTDSVLEGANRFVLHTMVMSAAALAATGLEAFDVSRDDIGSNIDHFPVVCDLRPRAPLWPGTGDDFVLETLINGTGVPTASVKTVTAGDLLQVRALSPDGTLVGALPFIGAQPHPPGVLPLATTGFSSVHIDPFASVLLYGPAGSIFGPSFLPAAGITLLYVAPPGLAGILIRLQAFAFQPSAANGIFAASDAHELSFF